MSSQEIQLMQAEFERCPTIGRRNLSKITGVSQTKCRRFLEQKRDKSNLCSNIGLNKESYEESNGTAIGTLVSRSKKTVEEMAEYFEVNTDIWYVERFITNSWDVTTSEGTTYTNYQNKIWWKRDADAERLDFIREDVFNAITEHSVQYEPISDRGTGVYDNMLEINIRDLHLGKLCWGQETGEDYDSEIAKERVETVLKDLIRKGNAFGYEKIILVASDDFFNSDTHEHMTTRGTRQDDDSRWKKMFSTGTNLFIGMIDMLRVQAPVHVVMVPGNHDSQKSFYLGETLSAWYNKCDNVTIDNSPPTRKYVKYGEVLLGFTHGDKEKINQLPLIMASECKKDWANTTFREFHIAHLHHRKDIKFVSADEINSVVVRQMRSLAGTDAWHYESGYVGTLKGAEAFVWNKNDGLIALFESNIKV